MGFSVRRVHVNCFLCEKVKNIKKSEYLSSKSEVFFCDKECKGQWQSENVKGKNHPLWRGGRSIKVACCVCGKSKMIFPSQKKAYKEHRCNECASEFYKDRYSGNKSPRWKGGEVAVKCAYCGKPKTVIAALRVKYNKHFCNSNCQGAWMSENRKGEKNSRWLGGTSFAPYGPEFNELLKNKIRERDGYKCCLCGGVDNVALSVHHIDYNKENNNGANLISLCVSCHSKTNVNREYWQACFTGVEEVAANG